jgi:uncharacterized membrane protein
VLFAALIGVLLLKEDVSCKNFLSILLVAIGLIIVARLDCDRDLSASS